MDRIREYSATFPSFLYIQPNGNRQVSLHWVAMILYGKSAGNPGE